MSWRDEEKALKSKGELPSWQSIDKYTIFYQKMLDKYEDSIEKMKCCGNCRHEGTAEWCNLREEFIHTVGYGEKDCAWKSKEDNV